MLPWIDARRFGGRGPIIDAGYSRVTQLSESRNISIAKLNAHRATLDSNILAMVTSLDSIKWTQS
jgi:hypothetical protein